MDERQRTFCEMHPGTGVRGEDHQSRRSRGRRRSCGDHSPRRLRYCRPVMEGSRLPTFELLSCVRVLPADERRGILAARIRPRKALARWLHQPGFQFPIGLLLPCGQFPSQASPAAPGVSSTCIGIADSQTKVKLQARKVVEKLLFDPSLKWYPPMALLLN